MMYSSVLLSAVVALVAAQDMSSSYSNPATQYLTQTDSNGVVTGMPAVMTSQPGLPAAVTTQPQGFTIPAVGPGVTTLVFNNQTYTVSAGESTTVLISASSTMATVTGGGAAGGNGSSAASTSSSKAGAAPTGAVAAAAGAIVGAAGLAVAFL